MSGIKKPFDGDSGQPRRPRLCMTPDECFAAGWDDGEGDRMPAHQIDRMVALHRPHLLAGEQAPAA